MLVFQMQSFLAQGSFSKTVLDGKKVHMQRKRPLNSKYLNGIFPDITFVEPHSNARPKFHFQRHMGSSRTSQRTLNSSCSCPNVYQGLRYGSTADCNITKTLTAPTEPPRYWKPTARGHSTACSSASKPRVSSIQKQVRCPEPNSMK